MSTAKEIISHFEGEEADLVVCDGAPDGNNIILLLNFCLIYRSQEVNVVLIRNLSIFDENL